MLKKKMFQIKKANFQEMFSFSLKFKNSSCVHLPGFEPDLNSKKKTCYTAKISVILAVTYIVLPYNTSAMCEGLSRVSS